MFIHSSPSSDDPYGLYNYQILIRDHYPNEVVNWVNNKNITKWLSVYLMIEDYGYSWIEETSQVSLVIMFSFHGDYVQFLKTFILCK